MVQPSTSLWHKINNQQSTINIEKKNSIINIQQAILPKKKYRKYLHI